MATSEDSAKKRSKEEEVEESLGWLREVDAKTFEFLETIIREAQYEGSIVIIVTIVPQPWTDEAGKIRGCKPRAVHCKKCKA